MSARARREAGILGSSRVRIRGKFNLVLVVVFALGFAVSGAVSHRLLHKNAREEVLRSAAVMMEAALSMRAYTVSHVRGKLRKDESEFLPEAVPAFSATEIMNKLRVKYPDYSYKEAAINPTNPRNRAVEWEADLIGAFRQGATELTGTREAATGQVLYLARPFRIADPACLTCHTTPEAAPPAMVKLYGSAGGFGWKLDEVIGAQIVTVPMDLPIRNADRAFVTFMASLGSIFVVLFAVLNLMLSALIVKPITMMAAMADKVSTGEGGMPEFAEHGSDEVHALGRSFNRMRRSLEKALKLIDADS